jgi:hypothetical protein
VSSPKSAPLRWLAALVLAAISPPGAYSQDPDPEPLRLNALVAAGVRSSATESWGTLRVEVGNIGRDGRLARVVVFYPERPDVQYARDIFVPGRSAVTSWVTVGPAPAQRGAIHRDVEILLYDRTGGGERLVPPPGKERVRSRPLFYRPREPTTAVLLDDADTAGEEGAATPEAVTLVRCVREAAGLSESVGIISERFLPPQPEAFDGIDVLVLAGNRLAADPAGRQAVRRWVQQGGMLWVLLDQVDPATVAPLLGDDFDLQVVDRVSLSTIRAHRAGDDPATAEPRNLDRPVEQVRVVLAGSDTVIHTANGWPASFTRVVGRGRVVFTTLGPRGWYRPRTRRDPRPRFEHFPDHPLLLEYLGDLAVRLHSQGKPPAAPVDALREMVMQEVGYTVVGRGTAALIFGGFLLAVLGLGVGLRRSRRPELVGWLGPAAAVGAAAVFVALGESSRRSVPPTVGVAAVVEAVPGTGEAAAYGVAAVYRPNSGPAPLAAGRGAFLDLDDGGLDGQTRRRVVTDLDEWHWEGLDLPAGIRTGIFRSTVRPARLAAVARFGADGVSGRLDSGPFRGAADGLVVTPAREPLAVRFGAGDTFTARGEDALPSGEYLTAAVLTDRQQRRQAVYRQLLGESFPKHWEGRDLLLAWAEPGELPFRVGEAERTVGAALLVVPLEFERLPTGTPVTVPQAFIPYSRIIQGRQRPATLEGAEGSEMELRFQLPRSVLPLTVERARLSAKVRSPARRFSVSGHTDAGPVTLFEAESPLDPIQVEITDPRFLRPDPDGGLRLTVRIGGQVRPEGEGKAAPGDQAPDKGKPPGGKGPPSGGKGPGVPPGVTPKLTDRPVDLFWKIESLGLEVVGRTAADR